MSVQKEKKEIIEILDNALIGHFTVFDIERLNQKSTKSLLFFAARLWQLMAIIESKLLECSSAASRRNYLR